MDNGGCDVPEMFKRTRKTEAMKKLEDYIHLYIGAKCTIHQLGEKPGSTGVIIGVHLDDAFTSNPWVIVRDADRSERSIRLYEIKLILRPIESMTNDEVEEYAKIGDLDHNKMVSESDPFRVDKMAAMQGHWLFKNGFDVYDLIPAGLAIKREG